MYLHKISLRDLEIMYPFEREALVQTINHIVSEKNKESGQPPVGNEEVIGASSSGWEAHSQKVRDGRSS